MSLYTKPKTWRKSVTPANSVQQLTSISQRFTSAVIQACDDNVGNVAIGDASCTATPGSQRGTVLKPGGIFAVDNGDLSDWYMRPINANDAVAITYVGHYD